MDIRVEKLDNFGRGITYINDKICFIKNALPGEFVKINILKENKKYIEAEVEEYIEVSNIRIKDECPYSNLCGGCHLNHISFEDENRWKEKKVKDLINKYIHEDILIKDIIYHDRDNYRNKIILHGSSNKLGLYKENSNEIINIDKCLLVNDKINSIIELLNEINKNIRTVIIKTSNDNNSVMISIEGEITDTKKLLEVVDVLILNGKYITKDKYIITNIGNKKYIESINSFFQVNNTLTKDLYDEVLDFIKDKDIGKALDLYCGTGTIGIYISDYCREIIGIDINRSNIDDAYLNKELNSKDNISFICDKVENRIDSFSDIDLVIVDPPRKGLDSKTRSYLNKIKSKYIIYVSCDPLTLVRDLADLNSFFEVKWIKLFNMFPRTYHCESITVLERK